MNWILWPLYALGISVPIVGLVHSGRTTIAAITLLGLLAWWAVANWAAS